MNLERYEYSTNETFLDFDFESEGPKWQDQESCKI